MQAYRQLALAVIAFALLTLTVTARLHDRRLFMQQTSSRMSVLDAQPFHFLSLNGSGAAAACLGDAGRSPVGVGIPPAVLGKDGARLDLAPARRLLADLAAVERLSHQPSPARPRAPPSIRA